MVNVKQKERKYTEKHLLPSLMYLISSTVLWRVALYEFMQN